MIHVVRARLIIFSVYAISNSRYRDVSTNQNPSEQRLKYSMKGGDFGALKSLKIPISNQGRSRTKMNRNSCILTFQETESHCWCVRKVPLSLYLHKKLPDSEASRFTSARSTNILSPSYRGWYFPARLCKIRSMGSHSPKAGPGNLEKGISVRIRKVTLESWVLVMVERHFSTNLEGRTCFS